MAILKIALLVAFACLVQSRYQLNAVDSKPWKQVTNVTSTFSVYDGTQQKIAQSDVTVSVYTKSNHTIDIGVVERLIKEKLSSIKPPSQESSALLNLDGNGDQLTCVLKVNATENMKLYNNPSHAPDEVRVSFYMTIEAKKKHTDGVFAIVKNMKPSL